MKRLLCCLSLYGMSGPPVSMSGREVKDALLLTSLLLLYDALEDVYAHCLACK